LRNKLLFSERYGAIEIDTAGKITDHNKTAFNILSGVSDIESPERLKGANITEFSNTGKTLSCELSDIEKIISSISGVELFDIIFYKKTDSFIFRFIKSTGALEPFLGIIKFSSLSFFELDYDLNIIFASDSFCTLTRCEKSELYGSHISMFTDSQGIGVLNTADGLFKDKNNDFIKFENISLIFKDYIKKYDIELFPVFNQEGVLSGSIGYLSENSAEKKFNANNIYIRRISALANFAGGIAHDYNNALTAVLGNISLAKMDAEKNSELMELLCDAENAGLKIKRLTERLGMFARGMKPSKYETDIKLLIDNIIPELFLGYKGRYIVNYQDNMRYPEVDKESISDAIKYVIENAVEAADKPDGEITIDVREIEINNEQLFREISLVSGMYIIISVKDNGPGLDPFAFGDIFDPYVTTKPGREGLGLALTYTILKRHRGFISTDTIESGGSKFDIYIPLF